MFTEKIIVNFLYDSLKMVDSTRLYFFVPHVHFYIYKKYLDTFNTGNQILNLWPSHGYTSFDLNSKIPFRKLWDDWQKTFITLNRYCPVSKNSTPPVFNRQCRAGWKQPNINKKYTHILHFISSFQGTSYKKL